MKRYEAYKKTNITWFSEIPIDWKVCKIKHIANTYAGGTPSTIKSEYWDNGEIPWLPSGKLQNNEITTAEKFISEEGLKNSSTKWIKPNTVLIALTGATCANIGYLNFEACANQSVVAIDELKEKANSRFLYYMLLMMRKQILTHQTGGAQAGINDGDVKNLYLTLPSLNEQSKIANYLDHKTVIIDALIEKKEQLIQKLEAQRQAIINEAVTKGLNPNAKMKDSGVEWLGEIPEHWDVVKLKYISEVVFSSVDRHEYEDELKVSICHYPDAYKNDKIIIETKLSKGTCTITEFEKYQLKEGQVIITKDSESADDIGVPTFITKTFENSVCGYHLAILSVNNSQLLGEYLFRYLQTNTVKSFFETHANGVTRFGLGKPTIENLYVPKFDLKEQKEIILQINSKTEKIDSTIIQVKSVIQKLKSYRQSIISEAVTGKIDVRGWQPKI